MAAGWHQSQALWVTWGPCRPGARAVHSPVGRRPGVHTRNAPGEVEADVGTGHALRGRVRSRGSANQMLRPCLPDLSAFCSPSSWDTPLPLLPSPPYSKSRSAPWPWGSPECGVTLAVFNMQACGMRARPQAFIPEPPVCPDPPGWNRLVPGSSSFSFKEDRLTL